MPKILCFCGERINLSPIPNPDGFKLIWESSIEKVAEQIVAAHHQALDDEAFEKAVYDILYPRKPPFPTVYECQNCKRLAVLEKGSDRHITFWFEQERQGGEASSIRSLMQE